MVGAKRRKLAAEDVPYAYGGDLDSYKNDDLERYKLEGGAVDASLPTKSKDILGEIAACLAVPLELGAGGGTADAGAGAEGLPEAVRTATLDAATSVRALPFGAARRRAPVVRGPARELLAGAALWRAHYLPRVPMAAAPCPLAPEREAVVTLAEATLRATQRSFDHPDPWRQYESSHS